MANIKSSKKNILINERNRARNIHFKTRMKTAIKAVKEAITTQAEDRVTVLQNALRVIDKTASKGIITKKSAATKKSKLATRVNSSLADLEKKAPTKKKSAPKKVASKKAAPKKTATKKTSAKSDETDTTSAAE